jgi:O-antigen/teichoic acid export membrane protein
MSLLSMVAVGAASSVIATSLHTHLASVLLVVPFIPLAIMTSINYGRLQGTKRLLGLGLVAMLLTTSKLLLSIPVLEMGFGVVALVAALWVSNAIVTILVSFKLRYLGGVSRAAWHKEAWVISGASVAFWTISSIDIFAARSLLTEADAGQYAVASTLAKVSLFLPSILVLSVFPRLVENVTRGESTSRDVKRTIAAAVGSAMLPAIAFLLFGGQITRFVYGPEYVEAGQIVGYVALAVIPLSIAMILLQLHMAGQQVHYGFRLVGVLSISILIFVFLGRTIEMTPAWIVLLFFTTNLATCLVMTPSPFESFRKNHKLSVTAVDSLPEARS